MGRAFALYVAALVLGGAALCRTAVGQGFVAGPRASRVPARLPKPLSRYKANELPLQRGTRQEMLAAFQANLPAVGMLSPQNGGVSALQAPPPPTTPQFTDLTTNPRPPLLGDSTKSQELHPFWTWDQQQIYFTSNNVDPVATYGQTAPAANARFHIYRMSSDGAFISQITGTSRQDEALGNQFYPVVNHSQTKLAYIHRPSPDKPYELYTLDLNNGTRDQLTGLAPGAVPNSPVPNEDLILFPDGSHPSWAPSDNVIAFAARNVNVPGDVMNIYVVDIASKTVRRLTNGSPANGVESRDPNFHPDTQNPRFAFAANTGTGAGPAVNAGTGDLNYVANPLQDLNADGSIDEVDHNLFVMSINGASRLNPVIQITNNRADDIEPAYERSIYPPGQGFGSFHGWLAFASKGRKPSPSDPLVGTTYDIYFNDGSAENVSVPVRLFTPDTNAGALPLNGSDERYPSWSSSLPPQNPIDRIVFSSNRQNNPQDPTLPTVSSTDTDLWTAEVTDITPPTIFSIEEESATWPFLRGEILHIANQPLNRPGTPATPGRRVGAPGDTFYFYAKVKDLQYGIESVWLQIKDPDGPSTDALSVNHRLYGVGTFPPTIPPAAMDGVARFIHTANNTYAGYYGGQCNFGTTESHYIHLPWETDYEGIGVSDYQYYNAPVRPDHATGILARYASKIAGVDDSIRWSGNQPAVFNYNTSDPNAASNRPPKDAAGNDRWLRLRDDGIGSDQKANDGIFSADWKSPDTASDYYVDLIAYDKSFDPHDTSHQQNWIIYDNIWGFSTQSFISKNQVLYVDDNGAGQKWPRGLKGNFRTFPSFRYGTESDIIDRPESFWPREVLIFGGFTLHDIDDNDANGVIDQSGNFTFKLQQTYDFLIGDSVPYDLISYAWSNNGERFEKRAWRYDIWRILAKGPLTETIITDYAPIEEVQPDDITGATTVTRPISTRAVLWNAPYMGDIYLGGGSILDQATQDLLRRYKTRHGRLVVAGGDIAWALTVDGTVTQSFLQDVLGADYVSDNINYDRNPNWNAFLGGPLGLNITQDVRRSFRQFANTPWYEPFYDPQPLGSAQAHSPWNGLSCRNPDGFTGGNPALFTLSGNSDHTTATDGTPFQVADMIKERPGWEMVYQDRVIANDDAATQSKTVFWSMSLASMGRRYIAQSGDTTKSPPDFLFTTNYRSKVSHAMFCWMFSAALTGQIKNLNGGAPIAGAWVQVFLGNQRVGAAFSKPDGTYLIRGLPIGNYSLRVDNPGFVSFNKATGSNAHGLDTERLDVLMTPAAPGSISGKVVDAFGQPIPGARIKATIQANALFTGVRDYFATTKPDGTYLIPSAPTASYVVSVDAVPAGFDINTATPKSRNVTVNPAQNTPNVDFQVNGNPGDLTVNVFQQLPDGTKGSPVPGATVTLLDSTGTPIPTFTGTTNGSGQVIFRNVPAGPVQVSVFKTRFQEGTALINIPQVSSVDIILADAKPHVLYGLAVRATDGQPLSASDLTTPVVLELRRKQSGLPIGETAQVQPTVSIEPISGQRYNYKFDNAQEGQFIVALSGHPRFFDAQVTVDIAPTDPNFAPTLSLQPRDGVLSGSVFEDSNGSQGNPIQGATVIIQPQGTGSTVTVQTGADGKWSTPSALRAGLYNVTIRKFGYTERTLNGVSVAGNTDTGPVLLSKTERGRLYGLTKRAVDQVVRKNVTIDIYTAASSPFGSTLVTTVKSGDVFNGPDGQPANYSVGDPDPSSVLLPAGDYELRVNDPHFAATKVNVTLGANEQKRQDIDLTPVSGVLSGFVKANVNGAGGDPVSGATVRIVSGNQTFTAITDATGRYTTGIAIPAASYTVTASAFGFDPNSVTVFVEGDTQADDILLTRVPPSAVSGTVRSTVDNSLIGDALVQLLQPDPANPGQLKVVYSVPSTARGTGSPVANFTFPAVNPGTYTLRAVKGGWTGTDQTVIISPRVNTTGLRINLTPEHIFPAGLQLIALPDDYAGEDAASLFGISSSRFRSAFYLTNQRRYAIYPEGPAREFKPGKGMFVRFTAPTAFAQSGNPVPNVPFFKPLNPGWNMIGSVRRSRVEWNSVQVQTPDGKTRTMQQAMADGIIQNGLWGYQDEYFRSDYMEPFQGYFVKAFQECTLVIPPVTGAAAVPGFGPRLALGGLALPAPPVVQVAAELRLAGLAPALPAPSRFPVRNPRSRLF